MTSRQRLPGVQFVNIASEAMQRVTHPAQIKAEVTAFLQVHLNASCECGELVHVMLPGQGNAISRKLRLSSLA